MSKKVHWKTRQKIIREYENETEIKIYNAGKLVRCHTISQIKFWRLLEGGTLKPEIEISFGLPWTTEGGAA